MFTTTNNTPDPAAKELNDMLNDCRRAFEVGKALDKLYHRKFDCDVKRYNRWIKQNLDISIASANRYREIFRHGKHYVQAGGIRLCELYQALGVAGKPEDPEDN